MWKLIKFLNIEQLANITTRALFTQAIKQPLPSLNLHVPFFCFSRPTIFNLIFYTIFIYFGALIADTFYIHLIGLEINKSIEILEIASYISLSYTGFISPSLSVRKGYIVYTSNTPTLMNTVRYSTHKCCVNKGGLEEDSKVEDSSWKNLSVVKNAIKVYETPITCWQNIKKDFKDKSGIYCWINKTNNKIYIGSASLLPKRLSYYFQPAYINRIDMVITKSLLKYGLINFALAILEETSKDKKEILEREDYYLNNFKPEYNILSKAGNSLGYKHTPETLLKLSLLNKGKKHTDLAKAKIGAASSAKTHTEETKDKIRNTILNSENNWADKVLITDLLGNKPILLKSKLAAAEYLGLTVSAISKREKRQTTSPYKGRYLIEFPE